MSTKVLVMILLAATTACYSWRLEPVAPDATVSAVPSGVARVTLRNARRFEVADPTLANDTLRGWNLWALTNGRRIAVVVPVSEITRVESRHLSAGKTTALALVVAAPVALIIGLSTVCWGLSC
jgi:hypothetical protein